MTFLEVRNSTLPSFSVTHLLQPPRLNTEIPNASLYPSPASHSSPPLSPIQVGTLSVSPLTLSAMRKSRPALCSRKKVFLLPVPDHTPGRSSKKETVLKCALLSSVLLLTLQCLLILDRRKTMMVL